MYLLIMPSYDTVRADLGYEEWEDGNEDAILYQQGYDGYEEEVEDGETFTVPEGYVAQILDDSPYYIPVEIMEGEWDKEEIESNLEEGRYKLEGDMITYLDEN